MFSAQLKETAPDTRSESGFILLNPALVASPDHPVITADAKHGNHRFLAPLRDESSGALARMPHDCVLYGAPSPYRDPVLPLSTGIAWRKTNRA